MLCLASILTTAEAQTEVGKPTMRADSITVPQQPGFQDSPIQHEQTSDERLFNPMEPPFPELEKAEYKPMADTASMRIRLSEIEKASFAAGKAPTGVNDRDPYAYDFSHSGTMAEWQGGYLQGQGSRLSMPTLMTNQRVSFSAVQQLGAFSFSATTSANRYWMPQGHLMQFGVGATATYTFSPNVSLTVFGNYVTSPTFYSMAAMPYIGTSSYGGFVTLSGTRGGVDLGVQRTYDPYLRRWITAPIITPKVKFNNGMTLELPVGMLVHDLLDKAIFGNRPQGGATIIPSIPLVKPTFHEPPTRP